MEKVIIKGAGKYANGVLTIITVDTLYDINLVTGEYGYRTIGDYWHFGGKVTTSELARLREECDKYYEFNLITFEILERRVLK